MKKIFIYILFAAAALAGCVNLDIPPKNIVSDDDLMSSQSGLQVYLARLYSQMPWEDFKYIAQRGFDGNSWLGCLGVEGTGEAVTRDNICASFTGESASWWGRAYTLIHDANHLIETLPKYKDNFPEITYKEFLGQGYFVRAYAYTQMARRFGGVPIVKHEISYPFEGEIEVPRSSERDTWDAILEDWDLAVEHLPVNVTFADTPNRYAALAFKSEAMLYAGSVAKYNENVTGRLTGLGEKTRIRVIGFEEDEWWECSNRYFSEAYKAAREVMESGAYSLYRKSWAADDPQAQYQNMNDMWRDLTSPENILVREYSYPILSHGLDAYSSPWIYRMPLSAGTCPTEDLLELYDGFDRYADGTIRVTDGADHTLGTYLMYDKPMDFFDGVEPRLRAYVIFPGDVFKKTPIEVRMGIYTGPLPIAPLRDNYDFSQRGRFYQHMSQYTDESNRTLYLSPNVDTGPVTYTDVNTGEEVTCWAAGANGPFFSNAEATMTGLYLRKYLDPNRELKDIGEGKSDQPFILMRYAEVLLAAAEAAVELSIAGQPSPTGDDMLQVATDAIRDIQNRAGAIEISKKLTGTLASRDIVRKERRKELAFEQKSKWDIRRWRVIDEANRDGFWGEQRDRSSWSDGSRFAFRGLYPFYSTQAGKWFFDICFENRRTFSYSPVNYYFAIPSGEVTKSKYIDQQPNR
ncbi:MAG: RagB/SusD family nutrient uptake outer membrane protein [Bacteroidales bacterium]|nr:RagB/SusD family nutrient uptake outer membrane protein [Bacteroidales bacterium]